MNISTRRIRYLNNTRSQSWIGKMIGISQSTVSRIINGLTTLKSEFVDVARNTYQREAYSNLKFSGTSADQARRFSWYTPETVTDVQNTMQDVRDMLEVTWIANKERELGRILTDDEMDYERAFARKNILDNLQKSNKTIEEIYTSGKKTLFV